MELDKFQISQRRTRTQGQSQAVSSGSDRIGSTLPQLSRASIGQHHTMTRGYLNEMPGRSLTPQEDTATDTLFSSQVECRRLFEYGSGGTLANGSHQGSLDLGSRRVPVSVEHPTSAVGRLTGQVIARSQVKGRI